MWILAAIAVALLIGVGVLFYANEMLKGEWKAEHGDWEDIVEDPDRD